MLPGWTADRIRLSIALDPGCVQSRGSTSHRTTAEYPVRPAAVTVVAVYAPYGGRKYGVGVTRASFHQASRSSFSRLSEEASDRCEKSRWSQPWLPTTCPSRIVRRACTGFAS